MMAYREAPPATGLPFPRKGLGLYAALAIVVAALVLVAPLPFFAAGGFRMFREGGSGMFALLFAALASGAALGVLGALTGRGKRAPAAVIGGVPSILVVLGALFAALGVDATLGAVTGGSIDPRHAMPIVGAGMAESDVLYIFGCIAGGTAFGAAAIGLLGSAASIDRARAGRADPGRAWIATLAIGMTGVVVAVGLRLVLRTMLAPMMLVVPALVVLTVLGTLAARNASLVRGWHDGREANAWLAAVLAAAVASAAGVVMLDVAAAFVAERAGLGAIAGESIDHSQRARILFEVVQERRAALICACIDGGFAFATVAAGLFGAFGRGPDGSPRTPLGAPIFVTLAGVIAMSVAIAGVRSWTFRGVDRVAASARPTESSVALPREPSGPYPSGDERGPNLTVHAGGATESDGTLDLHASTLVVTADRTASWGAVALAVRAAIDAREASKSRAFGFGRQLPSLSIRVAPRGLPVAVGEALGPYAVFLGVGTPSIRVELDGPASTARARITIDDLPVNADMDFVVERIGRRLAAAEQGYNAPVIVLQSPTGTW